MTLKSVSEMLYKGRTVVLSTSNLAYVSSMSMYNICCIYVLYIRDKNVSRVFSKFLKHDKVSLTAR